MKTKVCTTHACLLCSHFSLSYLLGRKRLPQTRLAPFGLGQGWAQAHPALTRSRLKFKPRKRQKIRALTPDVCLTLNTIFLVQTDQLEFVYSFELAPQRKKQIQLTRGQLRTLYGSLRSPLFCFDQSDLTHKLCTILLCVYSRTIKNILYPTSTHPFLDNINIYQYLNSTCGQCFGFAINLDKSNATFESHMMRAVWKTLIEIFFVNNNNNNKKSKLN